MESRKILENHHVHSISKECLVCGDIARGLNFNVITCMSCKAFFRRHAYQKSFISCCQFENNCNITKETRSFCSSCRLKKCFTSGMDPELIRSIPHSTTTISNKIQRRKMIKNNQIQLSTPLPLNLLRNDSSTLTTYEWTLLSNILHAFDEQNFSIRIQDSLNKLYSLPPKLRSKPLDTLNIINQFYSGIRPVIERSSDLYSLSTDTRRILTKHNLYITGVVNGILLCRELDMFNNVAFLNACNVLYGAEYMKVCVKNSTRWEPNGNLVKNLMFILAFSSNCSIVTFDAEEHIVDMSSAIDLFHIQNKYVTVLWKYLIYLYGFKGAILRFAYLVKMIIGVLHIIKIMPNSQTHTSMIDTFMTETERSWVIQDMT